jgi:hypothetical protein
VETPIITQYQDIQKCAFCWQNDVDAILGLLIGPSLSTTILMNGAVSHHDNA